MSRHFPTSSGTPVRGRTVPSIRSGGAVTLFPLRRREIRRLYDTLWDGLARIDAKVLAFLGPQGGEGVSTIAHAFAHLSGILADRQVLLLDGHQGLPTRPHWASRTVHSLGGAARLGDPLAAITPTAHPKLFRAMLSVDAERSIVDELEVVEEAWSQLRQRFALIVIDCPPAVPTTEGIAVAMRADAVALVIEAERTRAPMAREAENRLAEAKVNLLGVILNRRRHHIPQWLYRLL